jgi:hypothetical protein
VQIELSVKEKLNIGVFINNDYIPKWQFELIEELRNSNFANIVFVIKKDNSQKSRGFKGLLNNINETIFRLHLKLDEFIFGRDTDYAKTFDSKFLLNDLDAVASSDVEKIKNYQSDIILNLTGETLPGSVSKLGVLSYKPFKHAAPLGYNEVADKWETTESVLQLSNGLGEDKIIHYSQMLTHYVSVSKNRNACYWRAVSTILCIIKGVYNYGEAYLERLIKNNEKFLAEDSCKTSSNFNAVKNIFKHSWKVSKRVFEKMFYKDHWDLLYKFNSGYSDFSSFNEFKFLTAPSDRDWADPFVVSEENKHYIFIEEMPYKTNKAHLSVLELDNKGNLLHSTKILEKDYHLSYPFVFKYEDTYYMIPETGQNKTIELYKSSMFPYKWEFVMNLMENVHAADVTLFYRDNKWWLFCCMDNTGKNIGMLDELYLFYSEDLFTTDWQSHPQNPVCTTSKAARPAGRIFIKDGKIYRPSQDSSGIYGRGININEITTLSETEYAETLVKKILPEPSDELKGLHTFNFTDKIMLIDGFRHNKRIRINKLHSNNIDLNNFYTTSKKVSKTVPVLD